MPVEHEAKILDINPEDMANTIQRAGGQHLGDATMRRYVYDVTPGDTTQWIRLRDNGTTITLAVKQIAHDGIDGTTETEVAVDDFDTTHTLLTKMGFTAKSYQENTRSSWRLHGVALEIDSWPHIPPYLEIEGPDADAVVRTARQLGHDADQLTSKNTTKIYQQYGINLDTVPRLTVDDPIASTAAQ